MPFLTIFTPTYERAYILKRCYDSLCNQTNKEFIWLIVDDGSTDNTKELVDSWKEENKISIKYFYQNNSGKMIAHNHGVQKTDTELFLCLDSDDYLAINAVEVIKDTWEKRIIDNYTGIVGTKIYKDRITTGGKDMPSSINCCKLKDLYKKHKFRGETSLIFRTDILKKYLFPHIEGEKFIPETYVYDQIDQEGKLLICREKIYICEYLQDGYSASISKIIKNNPLGYKLYAEQAIKFAENDKERIIAISKYLLAEKLRGKNISIKSLQHPFLTLISLPIAKIIYIKRYKH